MADDPRGNGSPGRITLDLTSPNEAPTSTAEPARRHLPWLIFVGMHVITGAHAPVHLFRMAPRKHAATRSDFINTYGGTGPGPPVPVASAGLRR